MTTVGFIGSGHIGSTVARLAVEAGHQVVVPKRSRTRSRSPTRATTVPSVTGTSPSSRAGRSPRANCCCATSRTPWS
ncbi:NAD(P)-binding domain-containing protein [Streptomyces sp. NPDC048523]